MFLSVNISADVPFVTAWGVDLSEVKKSIDRYFKLFYKNSIPSNISLF